MLYYILIIYHINVLMQKRRNSIANALELCLFGIKPAIYIYIYIFIHKSYTNIIYIYTYTEGHFAL